MVFKRLDVTSTVAAGDLQTHPVDPCPEGAGFWSCGPWAAPSGPSVAQATSVGGRAEPTGEVVVQVLLIVADPGDVAVGAQQDARNIKYRSGVRAVIDPV